MYNVIPVFVLVVCKYQVSKYIFCVALMWMNNYLCYVQLPNCPFYVWNSSDP